MGLYPRPPEKEELELGLTRNQTRIEPEFELSAKKEVISLQSSAQAEAL